MRPLLAALLLALAGCGWHAGLGSSSGASSVGVQIVTREGTLLERGLEPELTDALSAAVVDWVELPLVSPAEADLVVRAHIVEFRRRGGVRNRDNELLETAVFVRASAELFDRRKGPNGEVAASAMAQEWSGYALDDPGNEDAALERALRHVADSLVLELFAPSSPPAEEDAVPR
jgi:hypothetical protein